MTESNTHRLAGSIFICYRREDSADMAGRMYDRLVDHFGQQCVFMDVEAIRLGYDFRSEIDQTIKACSIVIVMIGDKWLAQVDGKRRIDDENDRVRIEIEAALRREIPIIPVLTRGAAHPTKAMLPASLQDLAYRHGTSIRHEHFRGDVDSLINQMDKLLVCHESTTSQPAETNEPAMPVKLTQTTKSRPSIPSIASSSAMASSKERKGKLLVVVIAIGATVVSLLAITGTLMMRHASVSLSGLSKLAEPKLADQETAAAQFHLGVQYEDGRGVPKDLGKAAELYQQAANQGHAGAQYNLGLLYEHGAGVAKDLGKAVELYQQAADYGDADAQNHLGLLYEDGQGVPKDLVKATELYQKAANQGNQTAIANLNRVSGQAPKPASTASPPNEATATGYVSSEISASFAPNTAPTNVPEATGFSFKPWAIVEQQGVPHNPPSGIFPAGKQKRVHTQPSDTSSARPSVGGAKKKRNGSPTPGPRVRETPAGIRTATPAPRERIQIGIGRGFTRP
jgi:hypothetical protein